MEIEGEQPFIVRITFSSRGKAYLAELPGPPKSHLKPFELLHLRYAMPGDFVQFEGIPKVWAVEYRTWQFATDESVLHLTLDGPIESGE
jgi:hypothetical protein